MVSVVNPVCNFKVRSTPELGRCGGLRSETITLLEAREPSRVPEHHQCHDQVLQGQRALAAAGDSDPAGLHRCYHLPHQLELRTGDPVGDTPLPPPGRQGLLRREPVRPDPAQHKAVLRPLQRRAVRKAGESRSSGLDNDEGYCFRGGEGDRRVL